ncbi:uncharacterized protein LOC135926873 [Gordionus sp. m RMFG-2023]|uniref:uncharacterized protein LOC135926873 n=1 Tax=Gordionus sp. m RMFG-2023 TaxID=3053472 RepID=UPI0031FD00DE
MDYLETKSNNIIPGKAVILPSSFQGSQRNMRESFHDAMAIVLKFGKPDLFITFTCNPNWREIKENLFPGQSPTDRPDLIARVFKLKLNELLFDINKKNLFGKSMAFIYTIEFQKRGLPHAHILIILNDDSKIETSQAIDKFVCAEMPDKILNPKLFQIVTHFMIHGPCMENGICTKKFPKDFQMETRPNIDGYPYYKRRDNGITILSGKPTDNRYVIPYNRYLMLKFNAHINVKICTSIKSVKYIFKYIYKGYDCTNVDINVASNINIHDEIKSHLNARYVSACESMWRLLENNMHDRSHAVIRLGIHLPLQQPVYFTAGHERDALLRSENKHTTLTAWFELNKTDLNARQYLYGEIPYHYVFTNYHWKLRKKRLNVISRMYSVHLNSGERFFLRLLLLHVCGATSFDYLKTINGILMTTFKEAAIKRNLLSDDKEWESCLEEGSIYQMPSQLRSTFAFICMFCQPENPAYLWNRFRFMMIEDYLRQYSEVIAINMALMDIENVFLDHGLCCQSFDLPSPTKIPPKQHYDAHVEAADSIERISKLNRLQKYAFDLIIQAIELENIPERYFFVDGPGGSEQKIKLYCLLQPPAYPLFFKGGRTIHSGFKLPVPIFETSTSHMNLHSSLALDIKNSKLIIIDEATMMTKHALRCIDRLLKDIMKNSHPFGGKIILLGGDFRQTLPVVPKGSKVDIIESCIKKIADIDSLSTKIILTTKNKIALTLNNDIINIISGPIKHYYSADSIESDNKDDIMNFPLEFLHSQTPSGMPPHKLTLKVLTGTNKGYRVFLPRIDLAPSDSQLPFTLKRRQFPIIPAFVITINKSQGQTFDHVGLFLPEPVFAHGQLYVALTRCYLQQTTSKKITTSSSKTKLH